MESAVRAAGKWASRTQEAITNRSYEKGVRKQDYGEAVAIATGDGGSAYAAGITKRVTKIQRVHADLMPRLGALSMQIQGMPQDSDAQREQRLLAARRGAIAIGKARKGGGGG